MSKKLHWTQRPENAEKLANIGKHRWANRNSGEAKVTKPKSVNNWDSELGRLSAKMHARRNELLELINKLTIELRKLEEVMSRLEPPKAQSENYGG